MDFWKYFILFFFPLVGGSIGLMVRKHNLSQLKLFLAFSGAFLFSITAINLLPSVYNGATFQVGYFILAGFLLQIVVDVFSKGVEHGHLHFHEIKKVPYGIFIALSVHAFLEGMAAGSEFFHDHLQRNLIFGIALHEIPAAFALIVILKVSKIRRRYLYSWLVIYALMVPMGAVLSMSLKPMLTAEFGVDGVDRIMRGLLSLVIGVFLHISTTILFENSENHKFGRYKIIAVAIGVTVALLAAGLHGH